LIVPEVGFHVDGDTPGRAVFDIAAKPISSHLSTMMATTASMPSSLVSITRESCAGRKGDAVLLLSA
jgi:hypothetical protein